ncbi:GMC family oxidoreductase [Actinomadura sp. DC4]|uniref:GMC family oxidoreductase n=1 Tax=Actinomadura sp. DC4 TaxID=3055069 RepID=UPI0025AFB2B2|nr:GMC family oxidoreductase [Actinomadura sp. DC4]MDN3355720.1 GMC family oxidoreductase [Actinomadura sp. DC4]
MGADRVDVCVVGAGPAGAVTAKRLAESGFGVVVLEQGGWPDYSRARAAEPDFEIDSGPEWGWNPNVRRLEQDYPVEVSDSDIDVLNYNAVGGGSVIYAAQWLRIMPSDFRVRTLDGVADDWPLAYDDLRPYYERVEADFAVSGLAGDPAYPPGPGPPLPPVPLGRMGRRVAQAHNRLGWHWWPGTNAIATRPYDGLRACVQRAACLYGCADGAKASVDRTHWPQAVARGVRLETFARARRVVLGPDGLADGVEWADRDGRVHLTRAGVVVLCANGIGTPRLLLLSGLANSSGLVGRRLMLHPFGVVTGLFSDDLDSTQGVWGQHLHSLEFYETDASRGFVRGAKWGLQPTGGPLSTTRPWPWGDHPLWGPGFHRGVRARLGHSAMWGIVAEDLPEEANRVILDETLTDSGGLPAPKIIYRVAENSRRLMDFNVARARESLLEAGAYDTITAPQIRGTGWHQLGTARMGLDPARSVVDPWGRTHDVPNLFVFDGSTWPTSAAANPTATIAAMALRCAERLIAGRRAQEAPG